VKVCKNDADKLPCTDLGLLQ